MNDWTPSAVSTPGWPSGHPGAPGAAGDEPLLPDLIAARAAAAPGAPAVDSLPAGRPGLTYGDLDRRANRLAHRLRALGTGPGSLVGVALRRGPGLVVALLAVWRAGAAYVPMDPDHPADRLAWTLADTRAPLVLTEAGARAALPDPDRTGTRLLLLDEHGGTPDEAPAAFPDTAPPLPGGPAEAARRAAYVLYTSGSTGRPKGVVVPHGGIANRVRWLVTRHGLGPADRVLQKTTIGFDAAGLELFAPLVGGGTVVLAPHGAERDPAALLDAVAAGRATVLQGVPSVLRALADAPGWERCGALRLLFSAGEPLHAELCHRLLARAPQVEIWNTYGPTECSVDITEHRFDPAQTTGPVPIGRPLGGLRALVLDPHGHPVPDGGTGELHAGGAGVATGYLGRPGLTAERFVPDPEGPPGARLYRTGDRVRRNADGTLDYLGRLDQQLKVNGVRIEPGEVEAALAGHPRVAGVVVGTAPDRSGGQRLVAWVQPRGAAPAPAELRAFARRTLPDPMVPAVFVPVAAFPRTASGKTDRSALPEPGPGAGGAGHVPPRTAAERAVARAWAETLELPADAIGAHDDFFRSGGSSLHLGQLAGRLSAAAGRRVELRALFSALTVAEQAALLDGSPELPAADADAGQDPVVPVPRDGGLPLSNGQRGLWLLEQMRPGSPEWADLVWIRLPAQWTEATVRTALVRLADRHEILRTRYEVRGTDPVQLVDAPGAPVELRTAEAADPAAVRDLARAELGRGFDLARGPVWRGLLLRTADGGQVLLLGIHHIACDGWSSVLLERDLLALGRAVHSGGRPALPEVAVQYADHAVWQRRRAAAGDAAAERHLAYWRAQLGGATPLELPADRPRPADRDGRGALHTFTVPAALTARLTALGREAGATLHQTLLTAFAALLARLTGRTDLTLGMPVAGRHRPEVAQTAGYFLNTLVLRCRPDGADTVTGAVAAVRDTVLDALAHQDLPFDRLVRALQPERDPSRTPLYQVMFDFHEEGRTGTALRGTDLEAFRAAWQSARTDLTFVVQRQADGSLLGLAEYATALFDPATVERLAACWVRLLESFADAPGGRLADAELLPDAERARLLALGAAAPAAADAPDGCVSAAFTAAADRSPEATALVCGGERWSYARLRARAGWFANRLRALGAGPETAVAVLLPRSGDLLACLLGCWEAGAAYVPLDPGSPDERLAHILADSGARVLVSDAAGRARLGDRHRGAWLTTGEAPHPAAGPGPAAPPAAVRHDPARLAYVIYTSGSTGRPKGVGVEHRSLLRLLHASREHLEFGPDSAWLALAPASFDISFTELVMPLLAGGTVVLARDHETDDYPALVELIDRAGVTHLQAVHPQWRMLRDSGLGDRPLVGQTGGEPCPPELARELARGLKRFVNEYGPTEATIAATRWTVSGTTAELPIGRPYPHVSAHVLDPLLRPVPPGTLGELCLGGRGLSRGYAGRPALTAERFVPDPYGPPGARLYRTGDLARMLPDGTLVFAGRADGQVKIRGRRVETGEVAAVLAGHPGVAEAVVVAHGSGDAARLVGYCVPAGGALPDRGALLDHCARHLPGYMLPTLLVSLDALPLTRHNKIDLAALPAPDLTAVADDAPYTAPEGPLQEALAGIWAAVLTGPDGRAPRIGARNDFFRLGGDSIRAARVIARIQDEYDVALPLRALFDRPTVAALAEAVEDAVRAEIASLSDAELAAAHREYDR
ncbi:amino acid adenylation domain-containing protein [Streptomyces sp. RS10V-4]|uniref:non-ribosomal peptide synthetase n=1 Tax=Streptomyces rhizoryzae TaxID=2932493 RepID=UPI002003EF8C|nr:non-ribosomal peptide synthetase [Streptomyces rhizoryzae]MCK7624194.1 amino acid adenylation domain-containing protein [Streptomyces rhizoryzae]